MLIDKFKFENSIPNDNSWKEKLKGIFLLKPVKIENIIDIKDKIKNIMESKGLKFNGLRFKNSILKKYKDDLFLINTYSVYEKILSPRHNLLEVIEYILVLAEVQNPMLTYKLNKNINNEYFIDINEVVC